MTVQSHVARKARVKEALEICVQVGLAALLVIGCLLILRPFIPLILWGIIIAVAYLPYFRQLANRTGWKGRTLPLFFGRFCSSLFSSLHWCC